MEKTFIVSRINNHGERQYLTFEAEWSHLISKAILFNVSESKAIVNGLDQLERIKSRIEYDYYFDEIKDIILK